VLPQYTSKAVLQETQDLENLHCDSADDMHSEDEDVFTAYDELTNQKLLQKCATCGRNRSPHHFKSESKTQCTQCFESWIPNGIRYQGEELKTVHDKTPIRLLGIHHNMWLDAKSQRRKVIYAAIEVTAYLYKNDNLRIDQRLEVISMCLPCFSSFSALLIDWPESDLKLLTAVWVRAYTNAWNLVESTATCLSTFYLTAVWVRAYTNAWNLVESTATCLFTFSREKGGLQVKLPLGTLFTSVWGNLERCSQFDDGTRQMLAMCYQEALQENGCLDLLELQDALQHLSWKAASTNEVTFACYLANKLDIRVERDPFHPDVIASAPDATLAALAYQVKLPLSIQIEGAMTTATCLKIEPDFTMTILAGDRQHSILLDGQAQKPGLPSLHECVSQSYGQARWL